MAFADYLIRIKITTQLVIITNALIGTKRLPPIHLFSELESLKWNHRQYLGNIRGVLPTLRLPHVLFVFRLSILVSDKNIPSHATTQLKNVGVEQPKPCPHCSCSDACSAFCGFLFWSKISLPLKDVSRNLMQENVGHPCCYKNIQIYHGYSVKNPRVWWIFFYLSSPIS